MFILILVILSGDQSSRSASTTTVPGFQNRAACVRAGQQMQRDVGRFHKVLFQCVKDR